MPLSRSMARCWEILLCEVPTCSTISWTLISRSPRVHNIFSRRGWDMALSEREARSISSSSANKSMWSPIFSWAFNAGVVAEENLCSMFIAPNFTSSQYNNTLFEVLLRRLYLTLALVCSQFLLQNSFNRGVRGVVIDISYGINAVASNDMPTHSRRYPQPWIQNQAGCTAPRQGRRADVRFAQRLLGWRRRGWRSPSN